MKARAVLAGTKNEHKVAFSHPNGDPVDVLLRPITLIEQAEAERFARKFAGDAGTDSEMFVMAHQAKVMSFAALDPESPADKREPFFDDADFVLKNYHPDALVFLYGCWERWQDQCSPLQRVHTPEELLASIKGVAADDDDFRFFLRLSPRTRANCARFTARLALSSPELKSLLSSPTESTAAS